MLCVSWLQLNILDEQIDVDLWDDGLHILFII